MKLTQKDRSLIIFIVAIFLALSIVYSITSSVLFNIAIKKSDLANFINIVNKKVAVAEKNINDDPENSQENTQENTDSLWFNSKEINLKSLQKRVILLNFKRPDNINCGFCNIKDEDIKNLKDLFGNQIFLIDIYSEKSSYRKLKNDISININHSKIYHPILIDYQEEIANYFKIESFPNVVLIDNKGNIVDYEKLGKNSKSQESQDSSYIKLKKVIKKIITGNKNNIERSEISNLLENTNDNRNVLNFPTKIVFAPSFNYKSRNIPAVIIANSFDSNIVVSSLTGEMIVKIGSNVVGFEDGNFESAKFNNPQSVLYHDNHLYIADTNNHAIREVDFESEKVSTLIGSGEKGSPVEESVTISKADDLELSSPTDIILFNKPVTFTSITNEDINKNKATLRKALAKGSISSKTQQDNADKIDIKSNKKLLNQIRSVAPTKPKPIFAIANAGSNQILIFDLAKRKLDIFAGSGFSGSQDGPKENASLAYPVDIAWYDGSLYFIDGETSLIRVIEKNGNIKTLISKNLTKNPVGLFVDDTGIYVVDALAHNVSKYDSKGKFISVIAGSNSGIRGDSFDYNAKKILLNNPQSMIAVVGDFYLTDANNNRLLKINRSQMNVELLDIIPPLKITKNDLLEYMPNLYPAMEVEIASGKDIEFKINLDKKFKINFDAPNFLNLLEITGANSANLIKNFDWNEFNDLSIAIPPLENGKDYLLQGTFYYCEQAKKSVCKIKSYEQKIIANAKSSKNSIEFEIKN